MFVSDLRADELARSFVDILPMLERVDITEFVDSEFVRLMTLGKLRV